MGYSLGNKELDELLEEVEPGTVILVEGLPGAGKTTFTLSLAYRNIIHKGSKVLYMVFGETPEKLMTFSERLGLEKIRELAKKELLKFVKIPIIADTMLVEYITKVLSEESKEYDIIVIDSVTPILKILHTYKAKRAWIQNLYDFISKLNSGLLVLVADIMTDPDTDLRMLEFVADLVLRMSFEFRRNGFIERAIEVRKYRGKPIKTASIPFVITSKMGIIVFNYISKDIIEKIRPMKKPVKITCPPLQKLLSTDIIEPGTQILLVDKRGWLRGSSLLRYLVQKIYMLRKEGYNIHVTSFSPELLKILISEIKSLVEAKGPVEGKLKIREIDPCVMAPHHIVSESRPEEIATNIDILITLGLERLFYIYGADELMNMTINIIQMLKQMGVSALRYMMVRDDSEIPGYLIEFHDIVLTMYVKEDGEVAIKVLKNLEATHGTEILDREFKECPML
ncbi:hypothetical protein J4526_07795 [Desulfurococcaceae archaeon MEX13E-LK6-19]|nr:hypothetical protein J4526_07795 [Desulfurococcaceae archaeon MEX13E-LK6-19]